jgi:hypothetical protein
MNAQSLAVTVANPSFPLLYWAKIGVVSRKFEVGSRIEGIDAFLDRTTGNAKDRRKIGPYFP